jgi:hypothetical protein
MCRRALTHLIRASTLGGVGVRATALLFVFALVLLAPGAARPGLQRSTVEPPRCSGAEKRVVLAGATPDGQGPLYLRACGPARATVTIGGSRYDVSGGFCELRKVNFTLKGEVIWMLDVLTGLVTNPPAAPIGNGVWLRIPAGKRVRAGTPLEIFDGTVEVPNRQLWPAVLPADRRGTATLRKRLAGGAFRWREADGTEIRGNWTCR